ncbi:putative ribonuclease H-like domain-containing protein [Tanacetum coccineum]
MLVQVYVDDIIFGSTNKSWCDEFEALMKSRFQMSSMGELTFFLGLQVKQNKGGIFISQDKYVAEILKKFDLMNVKAAITPMETKLPLTKDEEAFDVDVHLYRSMIGSFMYLTASRPDIMYAVCVCSRFQVTPKTSHLNAVKRIFKYLKGKPNLGLWYPRESPFDLEAFSDSDYGGSNLDRKSTTGGCQFLGQRLISWQCKKQTIVATSTTEAEYVAAANCCGQVLWVQNQLLDYGFNFMKTKIHIDNESTICIVKNPVYHSKTKHIEIRHHFIRDCYEKKLISVEKIHTDLNVADLLTKPFDGPRFNYLVVSIGFAEIVDFLRGSNLRYALTANPTIYDSLVKQFWQSAVASTREDGSLEISATVDTKRYIISEASIRDSLQLDDATGISMLPNDDLFEGMGQIGTRSAAQAQSQPSPPNHPPIPTSTSTHEYLYEEHSPVHHHFSPSQEQAPSRMPMDDLLHTVPKLISRIDSLELDLKQTKLTMGNAIVKLVKKVKKLEGFLKRRNLVLTDSEDEEPEAQGRKSQADPQDSSIQGLVTPPTTKAHASGEEQVEDISPNTLEAAKTLSKVASLKPRSIDKGRRYKRRKETKGKKVVSSLDFQEDDAGAEKINTAGEINAASIEVNTASKVNTGSIKLNTVIEQDSTAGENKGQREGKAHMLSEETPKNSKKQILQEEASLAEAIRLDSLQKEDEAKQKHLDALLAQRITEEEELTEQQKKRKAQVQFEAQHYTNEDWDLIRVKLEANAELSKSMLGSELQGEDFAKRIVDLVNQRKKLFAEERAKAKRNKPMTQSQLKTYMMNYLKNQGTWKINQLKKLSFAEVKEEFDKLVKQIESFAPISFEATKASLKRFGEELQTKTPKRLKEDKDDESKEDESTKKSGKRRKQMARKGMNTSVDENDSEDSDKVGKHEESNTGTETPINPVPVAMKTPSSVCVCVCVLLSCMVVMNRYGMDGPEDKLEKGFWKCLRIMFEEPLSTDFIWSEIGQQKIISWRYYDTCRVHCLNLESMDVYMFLIESILYLLRYVKLVEKEALDRKDDVDCYRLLKNKLELESSEVCKFTSFRPWDIHLSGGQRTDYSRVNGSNCFDGLLLSRFEDLKTYYFEDKSSRQSSKAQSEAKNPLAPMDDTRTMAQLLEAPTAGYEDAIVVPI